MQIKTNPVNIVKNAAEALQRSGGGPDVITDHLRVAAEVTSQLREAVRSGDKEAIEAACEKFDNIPMDIPDDMVRAVLGKMLSGKFTMPM